MGLGRGLDRDTWGSPRPNLGFVMGERFPGNRVPQTVGAGPVDTPPMEESDFGA